MTTRATAEAMKTSFSSLPSPRKRGSVGEDEAAASLTTRARQSRAKGEDEAAASLTTRAIAKGEDEAAASLTIRSIRIPFVDSHYVNYLE